MKRWFACCLALALLLLPVLGLAEGDGATIKASLTGTYIDFTVKAAQDITGVTVVKGVDPVFSLDSIGAGESQSGGFDLKPEDYGTTVSLTLSYTADGSVHTDEAKVTVPPQETEPTETQPTPTETEPVPTETEPVPTETEPAPTEPAGEPNASVKVAASETSVKQGENVKLTYTVSNTGSVNLSYVELSEPSLGKINSAANLKPGESVTFTYTIKNISQSFTSKPRLTYVGGGGTHSVTGNAVSIFVATAKMTASLELSKTQIDLGDEVSLKATVSNKGDITFKSVVITEKTLGELGTAENMRGGESKSITKTIQPTDSGAYQLEVTATDASGKTYTYSSKSVTLKVADKPVPVVIDLSASTDTVQLSQPGMVTFSIDVDNVGNRTLKDVIITDQNDALVQEISDLVPGATNITHECMVQETTEFIFTATVVVDGVTSNFRSAPIQVSIALPAVTETTPAAEETTPAETATLVTAPADPNVPAEKDTTLSKILIGLGIVIAVIITALIALVIYGSSIRSDGRTAGKAAGSRSSAARPRERASGKTTRVKRPARPNYTRK